jgi:heavy metal sensor kinase
MIEMGAPITEIDGVLRKLMFTLLMGMPVMAFVAIAGGSFLVRWALQPVEHIRATAEKITFSNVSQRLPVTATGDALENLSITLNQMLERLEHAYQQASRFSADASHELRTPLTIIRSELESIGSTIRASQPPIPFQDRIGSVLEETERLSRIVEGLFALARLDAGEAKMEHKVFDLAKLVHSTVEQMQLLADEKRLSVSIDAPQPVFIMGDAVRLKQVVVNLLDNAIKYTMAGGTIELAVRAENSKAVLSIRDNGIGIPAEDMPHVFERFYRADKSRAQAGAGLGLSIVYAICQAHGGSVRVDSVVDTVTMVTVELPRAAAPAGRV